MATHGDNHRIVVALRKLADELAQESDQSERVMSVRHALQLLGPRSDSDAHRIEYAINLAGNLEASLPMTPFVNRLLTPFVNRLWGLLNSMPENGEHLFIQITMMEREDEKVLRIGFALDVIGKPHQPDPTEPKFGPDLSPMWLELES